MEILFQTIDEALASLKSAAGVIANTWYWILPAPLYATFKIFWMDRVQGMFASSMNWAFFEIIPPKNIEKSPKLMEAFYTGLQGAEKSFTVFEQVLDGQFPFSFSLELVGDGGTVHYYMRVPRNLRNLVEAHLYSQYPDIVIKEATDYVNDVPLLVPNEKWTLWGADFQFVKDDAYPIRTYKYFEETVTGKMIDPLSGVIEAMGKLPPGQKLWLQIIVSPHSPAWSKIEGRKLVEKLKGKEVKKEGILENIQKDITDVFSNIWAALSGPVEFSKKEKKEEQPLEFRLSPGEKDVLKAVEENLGKLQFKVKMRFMLIGRRENFDKTNVSAFIGGIKQFNDDNLNSFKPEAVSKTQANYVFRKPRLAYMQRKLLRRYRGRSNDGHRFTMSTEELATIYHFPDMSVVAPSLARVDSKRSGAPSNLPIE